MQKNDTLKIQGINSKGFGTISKLVMQDKRVPTTAKTIYAYFCTFAGAGSIAFPGRDKICYDLSINKSTFSDNLKYLVGYGYIEYRQMYNDNGTFSNRSYEIVNNPVEKADVLRLITEKKKTRQTKNKISKNNKNIPCTKNPDTDKPDMVNSGMEKPCTENSSTNINSLKINKLKINKLTTTNELGKNATDDVGDLKNISLSKITDIFYKLTSKHIKTKDIETVIDLLNHPLDVPITIKLREEIIINTLKNVYHDFKANNPNESINSFKYFLRPILNEFKKHETLKGGIKNGKQSSNHQDKNIYIDEYGRSYDFTRLSANR